MEDVTSPQLCDPLHSEDYTYSILSKALVKKQVMSPLAAAAEAVKEVECSSTTAHKAVHESAGRGFCKCADLAFG